MDMGVHKELNSRYYGDFTKVRIKVKHVEILIPNTFILFNNGVKKRFKINGLDAFTDSNFYIVNRWGKEVYKARHYKNNWSAIGLKEGIYYYLLMLKEYETSDWEIFKGYIKLIINNR